ncbi:ABC transporter permease [Halomonas sp. HL-93]|uniref:ABC transporter permease n=1 Tax=Halomonas sp. HL-93 TaxID=1666906 RepID=UPI0006DA124D|nr:ABC transporter permease [Halomonas sp. HL-93]KPQ20974.1 MAG: dipeptide transport system permease protein [Halomonas sp. HL-93]SBR51099.1 peptide/nickel transport system permease protein [Halomonas sp. HL-93]
MLYARLITTRLFKAVTVLFLIVIFNFCLIHLAPGDPAAIMAGEAGATDQEFLDQLRERFGLDQPIYVQLWRYISGIATLDFGYSYRQEAPVFDLIMARMPATLLLTGTAFVLSLVLGIVAGSMAAARVKKPSGSLIMALALVFYATPLFWIALMSVVLFSVYLGWLPAYGLYTVGAGHTGLALVIDIAKHLVLPATTLALFFMAIYTRMTRTSMLEASQQDYVKTARAKGLKPSIIQRRHVLRNALLPIITLAGLQAGQMVGGAILTETVFAWPGIGRLMYEALQQRDYSLLLGIFFFSAALVIVFNIITDLVYSLADPRIKKGAA